MDTETDMETDMGMDMETDTEMDMEMDMETDTCSARSCLINLLLILFSTVIVCVFSPPMYHF